jgi:hypothetical protein
MVNISTKKVQARMATGKNLIVVAGNIATGKSTLCKQIKAYTGIEFMEINNQFKHKGDLILESTGLGYRTKEIKKAYDRVFMIKCDVGRTQAFENMKARGKVFKSHELRLGMNEEDFYMHCEQDVKKLRVDFIYNYTLRHQEHLLNALHSFLMELGGAFYHYDLKR